MVSFLMTLDSLGDRVDSPFVVLSDVAIVFWCCFPGIVDVLAIGFESQSRKQNSLLHKAVVMFMIKFSLTFSFGYAEHSRPF